MTRFTLRQLEALAAVAEPRNLTAVAERLGPDAGGAAAADAGPAGTPAGPVAAALRPRAGR